MTAVVFLVLLLSLVSISESVWNCVEAPNLFKAKQIDAGMGQVVATNYLQKTYALNKGDWTLLSDYPLQMKYITTGTDGIWGVSTKNQLYRMIAGNFTKVPGLSLTQVDAGGDGYLVGSTGSRAYCLRKHYTRGFKGAGSVSWTALPGYTLKQFSCGLYGCWGVDTIGRVYHAQYITATSCNSGGWRYIGSGMKMVKASSNGLVFGLTTTGKVMMRTGVYASRTYGLSWSNIPMCVAMTHISYDLGKLWVVSNSGFIMFCTH